MKRQSREVYGYGAGLRTARRIPGAPWVIAIFTAATLLGALCQ